MSRPPRIEYPDAIYHVTTRGIEGRPIAMDDRDRSRWLEQLECVVLRHEWRVFAFALMGNHFHLFLQTPRPNLSRGMHDLNGGYVNFFNTRHQREGHLFQGRFKAFLVEDEGYWLEVSRYVHLNPVRAGIVTKPEDWPWSSYVGYHRPRLRLDWLDYGRVLDEFGGNDKNGWRQYREFVEDGLGRQLDSPFEHAIHDLILGSDRLVEWVQELLSTSSRSAELSEPSHSDDRPTLATVIRTVAEHYGVERTRWTPGHRSDHPARSVAAYLARRLTEATDVEIAHSLGYRNVSSIVVACRRVTDGNDSTDLLDDVRILIRTFHDH